MRCLHADLHSAHGQELCGKKDLLCAVVIELAHLRRLGQTADGADVEDHAWDSPLADLALGEKGQQCG